MIIEACGEFILPYLNANIIDTGAANGDISYILRNGVYMILLALVMLAGGVFGAYFAIKGAARVAADVRMQTFVQIQKFSFANIDDFSTGSLITRITNDITQIQNFIQTLLRGCFRSPVMLVGGICMSFALNARLAVVICIVIPLLAAAIFFIIRTAAPRYTIMQNRLDAVNNRINETITNERVIKSFVREEYEKEKFSGVNEELMEKSIRALKMMILMQPVSALAVNVTMLAVVWIAGRQIMIGDMQIGTLTAFITYLSQILTALNFLANIVLQGTRAAASDRRITEVLEAEITLNDRNASEKEKTLQRGDIVFQDVSFRYFKQNHEKVLNNINLEIHHGEQVGIIGSTGSGKTTLVSLIPRLYDVDEGCVLVDGTDVREWSMEKLRAGVAVVLQKNTLFSGSIAENLRWGSEDASQEELVWACRTAHAEEFIETFPEKYETVLEQGGSNLSGGQRQRLCIARALLKHPKILILDDSTSAVDTATDACIRKSFREELQDTTKIIIAQRIHSVMDSDKLIVMDDGKIVDAGTHDELLMRCREYQEIYYSQVSKEE
ncbi:ABC transporter, ATP-binding protein [Marvinbryantia formatexigens DSM 14469]|uniref:ABC transporter, ATP-binding protein n=2 Tax=Marvinbryantia TaxID=248744 RepID=C6L989_9FIRM|nr:ABC transporter ATP-binding protein [Marvinbryantia formatexigens]EET62828.1 ABC transporter, ATP-binding protein [Marvinbryantia formatexigens DSM 14469]